MENTVADYDTKIAIITETSGATAEEACRALQESGGDVNCAMASLLEHVQNTKKPASTLSAMDAKNEADDESTMKPDADKGEVNLVCHYCVCIKQV